MKVVILHPPMYPINHELFEILGKRVNLTVYVFGEFSGIHPEWNISRFKNNKNYTLKQFGQGTINNRMQIKPKVYLNLFYDRPDLVVSIAFGVTSLISSFLKNTFKFKLIISTDAIAITELNTNLFKKMIRKYIFSRADGFLSASSLTTLFIKTHSKEANIKESTQTIDIDGWSKKIDELKDVRFLRDKFKIPQDKKVILGVGGFTEKKNWMLVFQELKKIDDCFFLLIGSGELKDKYLSYIIENDLLDKVNVMDSKFDTELKECFKLSDIFVFPSLWDQFGYVVPEALASGLPVVCSNKTGASSLIKNSYNGMCFDPNSSFIDHLHIIISDLDVFKKNAKLSVENITLKNKAIQFESFIKEVINS